MISKIRMGVVGAAALGTAAFVIPAGGAQALSNASQTKAVSVQTQDVEAKAACWGKVIRVNGATLHYTECDNGPLRRVTGVLNDTKANGRCAWAKIRFVPSGALKTYKDCGGATTKFNTGWKWAADARVTLS